MHLFLLPLIVAALLSPATSDQPDYPIRTTSNGNFTSFCLPDKDKVFLAVRIHDIGTIFSVSVFVDGDNVYDAKCSLRNTRWDFVAISKKWINQPSYSEQCKDASFSETQQKPKDRSLVVTSNATADWQLFSFPSTNSDIRRTSGGSAVYFDLPAKEAVFLLYHSEDNTKSNFELSFFVNDELLHTLSFTATPTYEWDTVAIYKETINPRYIREIRDFAIPMKSRTLQGRRIKVSSEDPIQWQMFSLPLEPEIEGEIKDCGSFCVTTIVISCLFVLALIAAALYIYHLKASPKSSQGTDTGPANPVTNESQSGMTRTNSGNNEDSANANVGNHMEPIRTNVEDAEEPIYEEIDTMHEQNSAGLELRHERAPNIAQAGRSHHHNEVDTFGYMIPKRELVAPMDYYEN